MPADRPSEPAPPPGDTPATLAVAAAGVPYREVRIEPARSAEEAAERQGIPLGALLRTIVVRRGDDDYLFVLVPAGRRFDWPKLRAHLGVSRLSLPDADEARDVTGYVRYTITPFGSTRAWPGLADASLLDAPVVAGGEEALDLRTVDRAPSVGPPHPHREACDGLGRQSCPDEGGHGRRIG